MPTGNISDNNSDSSIGNDVISDSSSADDYSLETYKITDNNSNSNNNDDDHLRDNTLPSISRSSDSMSRTELGNETEVNPTTETLQIPLSSDIKETITLPNNEENDRDNGDSANSSNSLNEVGAAMQELFK